MGGGGRERERDTGGAEIGRGMEEGLHGARNATASTDIEHFGVSLLTGRAWQRSTSIKKNEKYHNLCPRRERWRCTHDGHVTGTRPQREFKMPTSKPEIIPYVIWERVMPTTLSRILGFSRVLICKFGMCFPVIPLVTSPPTNSLSRTRRVGALVP